MWLLPEIRWQICFFDLGLEEQMAGYTKGSCWSLVSEYPARDSVPQIAEPGVNLSSVSKEELLATGCDFLIGWDSVFSDKNFSTEFCDENGIAMYFPYVCSDSATFEDLYKDYETLGKIFQVEETAEQKIQKNEGYTSGCERGAWRRCIQEPEKSVCL